MDNINQENSMNEAENALKPVKSDNSDTYNKNEESYSNNSPSNSLIKKLEDFDQLAEAIINSNYAKAFEKNIKVVTDEGATKIETVVEKSDIVAALLLGQELGFSPMAAITLGKQLSSKSYLAVQRGKSLGLDPMTSLSKVYSFTNRNGDIITALDVSIITKCIIEVCDKMEYIRDYEYSRLYYNMLDNSYVGHEYLVKSLKGSELALNPKYFEYIKDVTSPEELKKAIKEGRIPIIAKGNTFVTSVRLVRSSKGIDKIFHYSIQDAIDAGLHRGFHSTKKDIKNNPIYVDGRDNWNNHPSTMLRNRVTSIAGRVVAGDRIQGGYSFDEASEIIDITED